MRPIVRVGLAGLVVVAAGCPRKHVDPCDEPGGCVSEIPVRPDDTDDTGDPPDCAEPVLSCTSAIKPVLPQANASDVFYRTPFVVEFTADEDATASFRLVDDVGVEVPLGEVTWSTNGKQAAFRALEPLAPETSHRLLVTYSCSGCVPPEIRFTTGSTGAPFDPADVSGATYALDLATVTIVEPPGVNSLLGSLLGQLESTVALAPTLVGEAGLQLLGGVLGLDGGQDACLPTFDLPDTELVDAAYFEVDAPEGVTLDLGVPIELLDLHLSGAFTPDGSAIEGVALRGTIDTRTLIPVLGDTLGGATGDDAVCNLVGTFTNNAVQCEACPGGGDFCLTLSAANATAPRVDAGLTRITPDDVAADPTCAGP